MTFLDVWTPDTGVEKLLAAASAVLCCVYALWAWHSSRRLPPGPWGLPLVGYLPWVNPVAPHLTLVKLVERYGRVFSLRMGGVLVVVMADPHVIRDVLSQKCTTGRAPLYLTHGIMKGYGLICSEGDLWRDHRKFVLGFMRDHGMRTVATRGIMEPKIHAVADLLTKELRESTEAVDISGKLLHHVGNTMNQLIFGLTYAEEDPKWRWLRHLLEEGTKLVGVAGPLNFLPWLRFLPMYQRVIRFITENQHKTHREYQLIIHHHERQTLASSTTTRHHLGVAPPVEEDGEEGGGGGGGGGGGEDTGNHLTEASEAGRSSSEVPLHIIDAYVKERRRRGEVVGSFTYEQLHHVAADLFGAGSETTITTLKWHLLNMALYPEVQGKIHRELDEVIPDGESVTLEEASLLPYTQASVLESQRLRSILPLGIPHGATQELEIDGYRVPQGTMLLPLQWYVHHDPLIWDDPDTYRPERFIDQEGKVIRHPAFMPFQTGRRMCIGDEFARMILFTFSTKILHQFTIELEEGLKDDPTRDPVCGISLCPRPFKLVFRPRVSN
ncbi:cytochrome P450 306a1 [Panulirus ornatus]|uniref:cytochrome P450 306a1 n=1 Tax=Panulirus ornatus TaxID=150431 RepID=UPI003A8B5315